MSGAGEKKDEGWFFIENGQWVGPVSSKDLERFEKAGRVKRSDVISRAAFGGNRKRFTDAVNSRSLKGSHRAKVISVDDTWLNYLIALPLALAFVDVIMRLAKFSYAASELVSVFLHILTFVLLAFNDIRELEDAGHSGATRHLRLWAFLVPPVYLYLRGSRTDRGVWPMLIWLVLTIGLQLFVV
ncbi:DUF4339 domain-containing protein [Pseudovibrio ascidiaceicola]|uniref:DUF4339 domain-containing protein n=1 Tax=Pseudovibrio ascidiaceicola TaxID=285279 RepID=UPI000D68D5C6|nr:DUF4339 domain-containing protein [Pseudovibrio ascidiaceicola]